MKYINSFDIDGVIYMGEDIGGVYPGPDDIIITGRSVEEEVETMTMLRKKGIHNKIYMNPLPFDQKSRESSGRHKGMTMYYLEQTGINIKCHFEDDPIQAAEIAKIMPSVQLVMINSDFVEKGNIKHSVSEEDAQRYYHSF